MKPSNSHPPRFWIFCIALFLLLGSNAAYSQQECEACFSRESVEAAYRGALYNYNNHLWVGAHLRLTEFWALYAYTGKARDPRVLEEVRQALIYTQNKLQDALDRVPVLERRLATCQSQGTGVARSYKKMGPPPPPLRPSVPF
jgi:hypothetical protein